MAFLGRYGHQDADVVLSMPVADARILAECVGDILTEEKDSLTSRMETDG